MGYRAAEYTAVSPDGEAQSVAKFLNSHDWFVGRGGAPFDAPHPSIPRRWAGARPDHPISPSFNSRTSVRPNGSSTTMLPQPSRRTKGSNTCRTAAASRPVSGVLRSS